MSLNSLESNLKIELGIYPAKLKSDICESVNLNNPPTVLLDFRVSRKLKVNKKTLKSALNVKLFLKKSWNQFFLDFGSILGAKLEVKIMKIHLQSHTEIRIEI